MRNKYHITRVFDNDEEKTEFIPPCPPMEIAKSERRHQFSIVEQLCYKRSDVERKYALTEYIKLLTSLSNAFSSMSGSVRLNWKMTDFIKLDLLKPVNEMGDERGASFIMKVNVSDIKDILSFYILLIKEFKDNISVDGFLYYKRSIFVSIFRYKSLMFNANFTMNAQNMDKYHHLGITNAKIDVTRPILLEMQNLLYGENKDRETWHDNDLHISKMKRVHWFSPEKEIREDCYWIITI